MNKLQRIEEMEKQLAALRAEVEQESKVEKWEPKGGDYYVVTCGEVLSVPTQDDTRLFGAERQTREAAERARDKMRVFNRLLAYVDEFAPGYNRGADYGWIVLRCNSIWSVSKVDNPSVTDICMPHEVAVELCRKLCSGEVVL